MTKNGSVVWDAPCVTGNVSKNYTTPAGLYSLTYKEKDRVLRGAKKADGTYEYESPVSYWMPFNGGIGFHDATWRSKFGGTIYQNSYLLSVETGSGHILCRRILETRQSGIAMGESTCGSSAFWSVLCNMSFAQYEMRMQKRRIGKKEEEI